MSHHQTPPPGQGATPAAGSDLFPDRVMSPGIARERLWLIEAHEAAERAHHFALVMTPPGDPRRERAARAVKEAADRYELHRADAVAGLLATLRDAAELHPGRLSYRISDTEGIRRLRRRVRRLETIVAGLLAEQGVTV